MPSFLPSHELIVGLILLVVLVLFDLAALRFGTDSRPTERDHRSNW